MSAAVILHPELHFDNPDDVVVALFSTDEKRSILASWASDLHAVVSAPELGIPRRSGNPIRYRNIVEALKWTRATTTAGRRGNLARGQWVGDMSRTCIRTILYLPRYSSRRKAVHPFVGFGIGIDVAAALGGRPANSHLVDLGFYHD
jgi:hypothetical protein